MLAGNITKMEVDGWVSSLIVKVLSCMLTAMYLFVDPHTAKFSNGPGLLRTRNFGVKWVSCAGGCSPENCDRKGKTIISGNFCNSCLISRAPIVNSF